MKKFLMEMPKGVSVLYCIQTFSTFSYAILYSSLTLFLTKQLHVSHTESNNIVSLFLAFNYVLQLLGGIMGGRFLSNRILFILSMIIETIGLLLLASASSALLHVSLSLFLVGCGLSFTCYNSMLTQRFQQEDNRRETAFILSYAAMSIGFCAGYIFSGFFDYSNYYQDLFYIGAATNLITVCLAISKWKALVDISTPLKQAGHTNRFIKNIFGVVATALFIVPLIFCFSSADLSNKLIITLSAAMFLVILFLGLNQKSKSNKERIMAYLILALTSVLFWMIYLTGPMSIILFIKNNTDRTFLGHEVATQWLLNINPLVIVIFAPLLSIMVNKLQAKYSFSVARQFACGFILLGLSFAALIFGVNYANDEGYISLHWVLFYFIFQGMSELLIAPLGYAMIGRIAPVKLQGVLMGSWMLLAGVAASLSHYFSNDMVKTEAIDPLLTNENYLQVFEQLSVWALMGAVFLFLISKRINRFMN